MPQPVILIHGLWMRGFMLGHLARRLRLEGHGVSTFDYLSLAHGPGPAIAALRARVLAAGPGVHLVGHSLGGLIALEAARDEPPLPIGNIVCLGSPLKGSIAARHFATWPGGRMLLGKSRHLLVEGIAPWSKSIPVGVIAGRIPRGLGVLTGHMGALNDGTVAVAETELDGIADHRVIAATHTGLAFSDEAASLTAGFLRLGRFDGTP